MDAFFRVSGRVPELWVPSTGEIISPSVYEVTPHGMRVPLRLAPYESVFVVFRPVAPTAAATLPHVTSCPSQLQMTTAKDGRVRVVSGKSGSFEVETSTGRRMTIEIGQLPSAITLPGPWTVGFFGQTGAPDPVMWSKLSSWTENERADIRYFSGIARYESEFEIMASWLQHDRKLLLDLGRLWAVGEVWLNDQPLGVVWSPPYRVAIDAVAVPGKNQLVIEVANTWSNRLVGDALFPDRRHGRTNITHSGTPGKAWKDIPLRESGLLGPVRLIPVIEKTIDLSR